MYVSRKQSVIVTGVTLSGNLGGLAMFEALKEICTESEINVLLASILPNEDKKSKSAKRTVVLDLNYKFFLMILAPLCLIMYLLPVSIAVKKKLLGLNDALKEYSTATAVYDLSGICFVDGRGGALLWYNIAILLPALAMDIPVYKLSQAVGPFNKLMNRFFAKLMLSRCAHIFARGEISYSYLKELRLSNISKSPDISFTLNSNVLLSKARNIVPKEKFIAICPSRVVEAYCESSNINLIEILVQYIVYLLGMNYSVVLLPHSEDSGIKKNNDMAVCKKVLNRINKDLVKSGTKENVIIVSAEGSAKLAREIIGLSEFAIVSRFHSMIAALSKSTPCLTIGWNHKYQEAAMPFGLEKLVVGYENLDFETLKVKTEYLLSHYNDYKNLMLIAATTESDSARRSINETIERITSNA